MSNQKNGNKKTANKGMSQTAKWILTILLLAVALLTIAVCARDGSFTFKAGSVQANDEAVQSAAPENEGEQKEENVTHKVMISAGNGGTAEPRGSVTVEDWDSLTVYFTPNEGYVVSSVRVDGESVEPADSYELSYVKEDHTVMVTFKKAAPATPTPSEEDDFMSEFESLFD